MCSFVSKRILITKSKYKYSSLFRSFSQYICHDRRALDTSKDASHCVSLNLTKSVGSARRESGKHIKSAICFEDYRHDHQKKRHIYNLQHLSLGLR